MDALQQFSDLEAVAEAVVRALVEGASNIGIIVEQSSRPALLQALAARDLHLGNELPASDSAKKNADQWREELISKLRREQVAAQERMALAKQQGAAANPLDRDVAGWLATGLCDLFVDPITAASFVTGAFTRIAENTSEAHFTEADFLRPEGIKFLEASRAAQSMLTKLSLASTSQFRAAAARLLNQLTDRPAGPVRSVVRVVEAALVDRPPSGSQRWIVVGEDEERIRQLLPEPSAILRYVETPAVERSLLADDLESMLGDLRIESNRLDLFRRHGLLRHDPLDASSAALSAEVSAHLSASTIDEESARRLLERTVSEVESIRASLVRHWQQWFSDRLAVIDAEWFLQQDPDREFLDIPRYMEQVRRTFTNPEERIGLPSSDSDFESAEKVLAALIEIDNKWREHLKTPVEEGIAFDAAVAAGGAPLSMLTEGVRWWLENENRDWDRYRIVKMD